MFMHLCTRTTAFVLAAGLALGATGMADAASPHHVGHAGGAHYGGHPVYHGGYSHANYFHGGYPHTGNIHGGYYRNYGYRYPFGLGVNVGPFGFGYPGYYGYPGYGLYSGLDLYAPSYVEPNVAIVPPTISAYPPSDLGPSPFTTNAASITVTLPADAKLWIDGQLTNQTGATRQFETPQTLEPGRLYSYKLRAEWVENGQPVFRERAVEFRAGNQVVINLSMP